MQPPPEGVWGMPPEVLQYACPATIPMSTRIAREARKMMEKLGYGPDNRLSGQGVDAQLSRAGATRRCS